MRRSVLVLALVLAAGCPSAPPPLPFAARLLRGHDAALVAGAISQDGRAVVSVDVTGSLRLWNLESEKSLEFSVQGARTLAFAPGGALLVAGCDDGAEEVRDITITDRFTGASHRKLQAPRGATANVRFSPDGARLVSWERDAIAWDTKTSEPRVKIEGPVLAVSNDGAAVLVKRTGVALIDAVSGLALWTSGEPASTAAFSEDGHAVAIGTESGAVELRSASSGVALGRTEGLEGGVRAIVFSPDGRLLVAGPRRGDSDRLIDVSTMRDVRPLRWQTGVHVFSRDSTKLVSVVGRQWLVVSDVKTGSELAELWAGRPRSAWRIEFSPDGRFLLAETQPEADRPFDPAETRIFSAATWKRLALVEGSDFVFTPDSKRAAWLRALDGIVCVGDAPE